jgi:MFS transporter, putative metabolite:H+ symporter
MFEQMERARLTGNQVRILITAILATVLEFYSFYLVGFVLAIIAGSWKLSYGQSAIILLSSGIGAIVGAGFWGWLADRIGRRPVLISAVINFSLATGIMAFTPDNGWYFLTILRFFVGAGVGGLYCVIMPLVQEFMPSSKRGFISGMVTTGVPLGVALGAALGAYLAPVVGWRGLFALGVLPIFIALLIRAWMPESPRWLLRMGRTEEARRSVAWALQLDPKEITIPTTIDRSQPMAWLKLFNYPRSLAVCWIGNLAAQSGIFGLTLWAPTLLAQVIKITPSQASYLMLYCSAGGLLGHIVFAYLSDAIGRRASGGLYGFGAAASVILAGYLHTAFWGTASAFWLLLIVTFFFSGGYSIVGPYSAEVWPAALRATGMGSAYGFGGIGKIVGPLGLALIVGSTDIVRPEASVAKIIPAFLFLGAWFAVAGIIYSVFAMETKGRSLEQIEGDLVTHVPAHAPTAQTVRVD